MCLNNMMAATISATRAVRAVPFFSYPDFGFLPLDELPCSFIIGGGAVRFIPDDEPPSSSSSCPSPVAEIF
jgi:hypothetical protein